MATKNHSKTSKQLAARRNKPSRAARLARRAKERDEILAEPARATERDRAALEAYQNALEPQNRAFLGEEHQKARVALIEAERRAAELRRRLDSYKQLKDYQF